MAADFSKRTTSSAKWNFGFQGQFLDDRTGLYNYGYRYYSAWLGRWFNPDPIDERDSSNLFLFVTNSAPNHVDLLGLKQARWTKQYGLNYPEPSESIKNEYFISYENLDGLTDWLGYYLAIAAIYKSHNQSTTGAFSEYGGSICEKHCCAGAVVRWTIGSGGGGIFSAFDDSPQYTLLCPKGFDHIGAFHSHPGLSKNFPYGNGPSQPDKRRFKGNSASIQSNLARTNAGEERFDKQDLILSSSGPEYISRFTGEKKPDGTLKSFDPIVYRLSVNNLTNPKTISAPQKPKEEKNNPCANER